MQDKNDQHLTDCGILDEFLMKATTILNFNMQSPSDYFPYPAVGSENLIMILWSQGILLE